MPLVRVGTRMLMLTAVRTTELRKATWSEVDTKAKLWRIPAHRMKAGVEHVVPLSPQMLELLATLRTMTGDGDLLLPNLLDPEQPMSPNAIIGNIKEHGLRRARYRPRHALHVFGLVQRKRIQRRCH